MTISVLSDISAALDDQTLQRLAENFDTPALQVRYGIDLASRHILENLVKHSDSLEGAQGVYKTVGQFNGAILNSIRGDVEFEQTVNEGTGSITQLVGGEFDQMVESVQTSSDTSQIAAAKIVGVASALALDALGVRKAEFDLNRNGLTDFLRTQTGVSGEPPMRTTDSQMLNRTTTVPPDPDRIFPTTMTAPMEQPSAPQVSSEPVAVPTAPAFAPDMSATTPAPDTTPAPQAPAPAEAAAQAAAPTPLSKTSALEQLNLGIKPSQPAKEPLKAKKTTPIDPAGDTQPPLSPTMKAFTIAAPVLVILGTTLYAWRIIDQQSAAIERLMVSTSESLGSLGSESTPTGDGLATSDPASTSGEQESTRPGPTFTKNISIEMTSDNSLSRPFRRYEFDAQQDITQATFASAILQPESTKQYWWDQNRISQPDKGKILAGPWQIPNQPRNTTKQSYFSYK